MPELLVRAIDDVLAERIKRFTRARGAPLNQCMLELLNLGLDAEAQKHVEGGHAKGANAPDGSGADNMPSLIDVTMRETRILGGTWNSDEAGAFRDALKSLENIPDAPNS
jgi:hypothetical protein